jgi:catechol 2,3-dioxygenase-like lactoylglutathione lyase family enzyme
MTATATATGVTLHFGVYVADLGRSVHFYRLLLGTAPVWQAGDHARFESANPPLLLTLTAGNYPPGGSLNHLGLRLPDGAALVEVQRRLEEAGIATQRQEGVECCYARQTKFWVTDPEGNLIEIYVFEEDLDHSGFDDPPAPTPRAEPPGQSGCVLYKGPLDQVEDDDGTVFRRGQRVAVNPRQWALLRNGPAAGQFAFFPGEGATP